MTIERLPNESIPTVTIGENSPSEEKLESFKIYINQLIKWKNGKNITIYPDPNTVSDGFPKIGDITHSGIIHFPNSNGIQFLAPASEDIDGPVLMIWKEILHGYFNIESINISNKNNLCQLTVRDESGKDHHFSFKHLLQLSPLLSVSKKPVLDRIASAAVVIPEKLLEAAENNGLIYFIRETKLQKVTYDGVIMAIPYRLISDNLLDLLGLNRRDINLKEGDMGVIYLSANIYNKGIIKWKDKDIFEEIGSDYKPVIVC